MELVELRPFGNYILYSSSFLHIQISYNIVRYGYGIQAHSKEQQNVILLGELLIAQPTQGLIIQCSDYTSSFLPLSLPSSLSYCSLFKHFITLLYLGQKMQRAWKRRENRLSHFSPKVFGMWVGIICEGKSV